MRRTRRIFLELIVILKWEEKTVKISPSIKSLISKIITNKALLISTTVCSVTLIFFSVAIAVNQFDNSVESIEEQNPALGFEVDSSNYKQEDYHGESVEVWSSDGGNTLSEDTEEEMVGEDVTQIENDYANGSNGSPDESMGTTSSSSQTPPPSDTNYPNEIEPPDSGTEEPPDETKPPDSGTEESPDETEPPDSGTEEPPDETEPPDSGTEEPPNETEPPDGPSNLPTPR